MKTSKIGIGILGIVVVSVIIGTLVGFGDQRLVPEISSDMESGTIGTASETHSDSEMTETEPDTTDDSMSVSGTGEGYKGEVIAGSTTPYIRFSQADYDKARSEGKAIYLYYYATWCSICAAERPGIFAAFNELELENAVGFEVHWSDGKNTQEDNDIAREFGVGSQHTHVYIDKDGNMVHKTLQPSSKDEIKNRLSELAQL